MPEQQTLERARRDREEGKSSSTQAGEFVREEMHHIREGKHGARSTKQAIAIGLSKARRAGVELGAPAKGKASEGTRKQAKRDLKRGSASARGKSPKKSGTRSRATLAALKREGRSAASSKGLSRQAHAAARKRGSQARHQAALKAVRTKGASGRSEAARKAARTRATHRKAA